MARLTRLGRAVMAMVLVSALAALAATLAILAVRRNGPPADSSLRVWSWNALANSYEGPTGVLDDRVAALGEDVATNADVVGLQEIHLDSATQVSERVGSEYAWLPSEAECAEVEVGQPSQEGGLHCVWVQKHDPVLLDPEGVAIVSRHELRDIAAHLLTGDRYAETDPNRRVVIAATVSAAGDDVRVYSTHLATRCSERNGQAQQILDQIERDRRRSRRPFAAVVVGDMNSTPQTRWCDEPAGASDEALYVFGAAGLVPPWGAQDCVALCALAGPEGLEECRVDRSAAAEVWSAPASYEQCGFTLRRKESWDPATDPPEVPYQTVDYVLIDRERARFERYDVPWIRRPWPPGATTAERPRFERYLAISDHLPVRTVIRFGRQDP